MLLHLVENVRRLNKSRNVIDELGAYGREAVCSLILVNVRDNSTYQERFQLLLDLTPDLFDIDIFVVAFQDVIVYLRDFTTRSMSILLFVRWLMLAPVQTNQAISKRLRNSRSILFHQRLD
jgi:hypothetical protein